LKKVTLIEAIGILTFTELEKLYRIFEN